MVIKYKKYQNIKIYRNSFYLPGSGQYFLLDRIDSHETQHTHLVLLTNTMSTILSLQVLMRIPIRVEDNDRVGFLQVETETTSTRGQQENKIVRIGIVENSEQITTLLGFGATIETQILEIAVDEIVLHDGHELSHLTKHEHTMSSLLELGQDAIEQLEFATRSINLRPVDDPVRVVQMNREFLFDVLKNERMVADLSQLHDRVHQRLGAVLSVRRVGQQHAVRLHVMIDDALQRRHVAFYDILDLVGQLRLDLFLETTQQERSQHFVQTTNDEQRFLLIELDFLASGGERRVEPLLECRARFEYARQQEVEQSPQLGQFVLERRAGQEEAVRGEVERVEYLGELAVVVLHAVAFVDYHVAPFDFGQTRLVAYHVLVRRGQHVEFAGLEQIAQIATLHRVALVYDVDHRWSPSLELVHPVREGRQRHDDQEWPIYLEYKFLIRK